MTGLVLRLTGMLLLALAPVAVSAQDVIPAPAADPNGRDWWAERHRAILRTVAAHPDPDVVLIGDSITNNYDKASPPDENFQPTWQTFYAPRRAINLGFSGDTTANVLWRLQHGEVAGLKPKVAIMLIGTNDTGHAGRSAAQTVSGVDAVVADLQRRLPTTKILLLGILPSAVSDTKTATDQSVNTALARRYGEDSRATFLDIGSVLLDAQGRIDPALFYDPRLPQHGKPLHPDTRGQRMMAEAIEPTLARMLGAPPILPLSAMTGANTALIPVPRLEQDSYNWYARHHAVLEALPTSTPEVVMIGDSITHFWAKSPNPPAGSGPASWRTLFGKARVLNLGFGWDRTQNVLWRLRHGEIAGLAPRDVVINIGTNNLTGTDNARANTPAEVVAGIAAIVDEVRNNLPGARIVLMGIFPRGADQTSALRGPILETNRLLAVRFGHDSSVRYLDIGTRFLDRSGALPTSLMPDGTHPSEAGYAIWGAALKQVVIAH